jgi:hypothetical protein
MFVAGLDLGQLTDFTVLSAVERMEQAKAPPRYVLRGMERYPLGQPYTVTAGRVAERLNALPLQGCTLVIDAGGPGRPVFDIFAREEMCARLVPVTITGGRTVNASHTGITVPKGHLVSTLVALFQEGRLTFARVEGLGTLIAELKAFRVKQTASGHERFEALTDRDHDDTVVSLALACWWAEKGGQFEPPPVVEPVRESLEDRLRAGHSRAAERGLFGMRAR